MNKNKLNLFAAISISVLLLAFGTVVIFQMAKSQQINEMMIDQCFENLDKVEKVVVKKDHLLSPVTCERE